jgi:hypothetical protein
MAGASTSAMTFSPACQIGYCGHQRAKPWFLQRLEDEDVVLTSVNS